MPGAVAYSILDSTQPGTSTAYPTLRQMSVTDPNAHTSTATRSVICGVSGTTDTGCYVQIMGVDADEHEAATLTTATSSQHGKVGRTLSQTSEVIHTNKKHPFFTVERRFLPIGQMKVGMPVVQFDGIWLRVQTQTDTVKLDKRQRKRKKRKGKKVVLLVALGLWTDGSGTREILDWQVADGESKAAWELDVASLVGTGLAS